MRSPPVACEAAPLTPIVPSPSTSWPVACSTALITCFAASGSPLMLTVCTCTSAPGNCCFSWSTTSCAASGISSDDDAVSVSVSGFVDNDVNILLNRPIDPPSVVRLPDCPQLALELVDLVAQ